MKHRKMYRFICNNPVSEFYYYADWKLDYDSIVNTIIESEQEISFYLHGIIYIPDRWLKEAIINGNIIIYTS